MDEMKRLDFEWMVGTGEGLRPWGLLLLVGCILACETREWESGSALYEAPVAQSNSRLVENPAMATGHRQTASSPAQALARPLPDILDGDDGTDQHLALAQEASVTVSPRVGTSPVSEGFQASFNYLGNALNDEEAGWYYYRLQGVASDGAHWFFTNTHVRSPLGRTNMLWRVPLTCSLDDENDNWCNPTRRLQDHSYPLLEQWGCDHFGDLDEFRFNGETYLVIPIEGCSNSALLAFFRASDLKHMAQVSVNYFQGGKTPWVAVDNDGFIYSSKDDQHNTVHRYRISWPDVQNAGAPVNLQLLGHWEHNLLEANGDPFWVDDGNWLQGGDFSADGEYFYVLENEGTINVFRTGSGSWWLMKRSSNSQHPFKYETEFNQEPEGLDYTDITDKAYGQHKGELHAILLNNNGLDNSIWFKHYTSVIDVNPNSDGNHGCDPIGYTLYDKWSGHGAWNGSILRLAAGSYEQSGSFSLNGAQKTVKLTSTGPARIFPNNDVCDCHEIKCGTSSHFTCCNGKTEKCCGVDAACYSKSYDCSQ